jgi:hypothetical protein
LRFALKVKDVKIFRKHPESAMRTSIKLGVKIQYVGEKLPPFNGRFYFRESISSENIINLPKA